MDRVLITGGSGFMGTNLVETYRGRSDTVIANFDVRPPRNPTQAGYFRHVDLRHPSALLGAVERFAPTHIVHLGARTDLGSDRVEDYAANTQGVRNLLQVIKQVGSVQRVIFASSRLVCRIGHAPSSATDFCPPNAYGESKVMGELEVRAADLRVPWLIVRPTSIWGPWFDVPYRDFFTAVQRGRFVMARGAHVRKSFGYIDNAVFALVQLMHGTNAMGAPWRDTIYLADYEPIEVTDMAEAIRSEFGAPRIRQVPKLGLRATALVGDMLQSLGWKRAPLTSFRLNNLLTEMVYDVGPLRAAVGPLPISMRQGVNDTVAWMLAHPKRPHV